MSVQCNNFFILCNNSLLCKCTSNAMMALDAKTLKCCIITLSLRHYVINFVHYAITVSLYIINHVIYKIITCASRAITPPVYITIPVVCEVIPVLCRALCSTSCLYGSPLTHATLSHVPFPTKLCQSECFLLLKKAERTVSCR